MSGRTCTIEGCGRKHRAKGYCQRHYNRYKRGLPVEGPVRKYRQNDGYVKECSMCEQTKPLDDFYRRAEGQPTSMCKVCQRAVMNKGRKAVRESYEEGA